MVNHYETAFVLTPVLSEPQTKEAVEKFENLLTQNGGTILTLSKVKVQVSTSFFSLMQILQ